MEAESTCSRCGYDRDRDEERKLELGHWYHRLRTMLQVVTDDEAEPIWVCERCHGPGEAILEAERRSAKPKPGMSYLGLTAVSGEQTVSEET